MNFEVLKSKPVAINMPCVLEWEMVKGWRGQFLGVHQETKGFWAVTHLVSGCLIITMQSKKADAVAMCKEIESLPFSLEQWVNLCKGQIVLNRFTRCDEWKMRPIHNETTERMIESMRNIGEKYPVFRYH